ncbi:hypothetical protein ACGFNU_21545 [Spirillospora sp. NPDC048911]|uniref:competence protein CoiA family protein n=1 Tax=Spirillospora sp. NPDC048911 TaxID=3364527 RepID=UPI0037233630
MAFSVYHVGLDLELNLTLPDLGHPDLPGLWDALRADDRPVPERQLQCIQCRQTRPHCPEWMFLTERDGKRFASHFTRGIADHAAENESDEHKAYKERILRAAELGGFLAEAESRSTDGKRRTDVLVKSDDRQIGWEIQLSYTTLDSVRKRASLARRDQITPLWATIDAKRDFIDRVPWARLDDMSWHDVAEGRLPLLVRGGVQSLELFRCERGFVIGGGFCPVRGRGYCGELHGHWQVARRVYVDDLVRASAAGDYVPVVVPNSGPRGYNRWWVNAADRDRYLDMGFELLPEGDYQRRKAQSGSELEASPLDPKCHYGEDSGIRSAPTAARDDGTPVVTTAVPRQKTAEPEQPFLLDWTSRTHWGGGTARPCRSCGKPALLVDDFGKPLHKTCAERLHSEDGQR